MNEYEWCDLESPFANPTCPLPTYLMVFPNLLLKIAVCVLIPPVLDEFAEEYMKGQGPPLKIWNNILLEMNESIDVANMAGSAAAAAGLMGEESWMPHAEDAAHAAPASTFDKSAALAELHTRLDRERHLFADFHSEVQTRAERTGVPSDLLQLARNVARKVDSRVLLPPDRRAISSVFLESATQLLSQAGLGLGLGALSESAADADATASVRAAAGFEQSPRSSGMSGGGAGLAAGHRGKKLEPQVKSTLYNALVTPMTQNLVKQVTYSVAAQVVPPLFDALTDVLRDELPDAITHAVQHVAGNAVGMSVGTTVPESVERLLPMAPLRMLTEGLTQALTRSVGHALTHTLTHAVGSKPVREYYCYYCQRFGWGCRKCHEHNTSPAHYTAHYAHFFSSYLSDYYADHYAKQIYTIMGKDRSS